MWIILGILHTLLDGLLEMVVLPEPTVPGVVSPPEIYFNQFGME